jgi:hypothetical protein
MRIMGEPTGNNGTTCSAYSPNLKMKAACSSDMMVPIYQIIRRPIQEYCNLQSQILSNLHLAKPASYIDLNSNICIAIYQ